MTEYKAGDEITIPTSYLGSKYGIGKVISVWADGKKMAVDFKGHVGHYTVENHKIHRAIEVYGFKIGIDERVPKDQVLIKY